MTKVYILGGEQSDFAQHWTREGRTLFDLMADTVTRALDRTRLEPQEIQTAHVGNFVAELFSGQGLLGGYFASIEPAFDGLPTSRHEAACASGSIALLAASAEIEAGRYDLACVTGIELMRNVHGDQAAEYLGAAAWQGREYQDVRYIWPAAFSDLTEEYDRRYGIRSEHLGRIAEINFSNAKSNPNSQTRKWQFQENSFCEDDEQNPVIEGRVRRQDCGQVTDGCAVVFLASEERAREYARARGLDFARLPYIRGWGHRSARMPCRDKMEASRNADFVLPHVRGTIEDAFRRAEIPDVSAVDVIETHDCFSMTEYAAIDHFGITAPGESWKAVEEGSIEKSGSQPINPSGGLIGLGHPVGATGVRMLLDASKQVTDSAGDYQIGGAKTAMTLNIGGSATTTVSFVVGT